MSSLTLTSLPSRNSRRPTTVPSQSSPRASLEASTQLNPLRSTLTLCHKQPVSHPQRTIASCDRQKNLNLQLRLSSLYHLSLLHLYCLQTKLQKTLQLRLYLLPHLLRLTLPLFSKHLTTNVHLVVHLHLHRHLFKHLPLQTPFTRQLPSSQTPFLRQGSLLPL